MLGGVLQRLPLFAGLPAETASLLEAGSQKRSFRRGEVIFHKGDPGSSMFLIVEGQVRIVLPSDGGEEALLGVLDSGDFFGELSLIDGQPRSATIIASEPTETIMLHREDFLKAIHTSPAVAVDMLKILARRLRETDEFVEDAIFLDVPGRLAKKLLELGDAYGDARPDGTVIGLRLTQSELATMVGATRESVNKHLRSYRSRGIIDVNRQRIVIRRPEELQRRIY
jgi:CRP/FNR family transcriptional regulator/CRP/FNR family cyclic AMP-dependent transcriptional regulator